MTRASAKKLALLLPDFSGGGAERVALALVRDWVAAGHEVDLLLLRAEGRLLELLPAEVRVVNLAAPRIRDALSPLRRYFRSRKPDAIQISMWPLTILGIIAHRLARSNARIVVSEHIALSKQYANLGRFGLFLLKQSIAHLYPLADARVAVSGKAADDLARLSGIDRKAIAVLYNPVTPPTDAAVRHPQIDPRWRNATLRILTVGRLSAQKNQALLIRAFARLPRPDSAKLMIVGEGPLQAELEHVAAAEGVADQILLPGFFLDLAPLYASADLFVLSSDYEGFGLVLVEAMQCGVPVVSTDCESGPREILADGSFGKLVPCGDAEALCAAMAQALDATPDPERLRDRAASLSGHDTPRRYLSLMLGED